jgi:cytochrome P450
LLPSPAFTFLWWKFPYPLLEHSHRRFGDAFTIKLIGLPPIVMFSNPDVVREVFLDDGTKMEAGRFNRSLAVLLGERSVLMTDGRTHARKRKLLMPPFHGARMQAYARAMLDLSDRAIDAFPRGEAFALHPFMQEVTLRVIVRTIFGALPRAEDELVAQLGRILDVGTSVSLLIPPLQRNLWGRSPYARFLKATREADRTLYGDIRARRESGARGNDVLSLLLDARDEDGKPIPDDELRDELVTLLVAGHETTATALTWAVRWILEKPAVLARLREELPPEKCDDPATIEKSPWLDAIVREALRLQPVIPLVGRALARPVTLGGWDLPEGIAVTCSIYLAQRRPEIYPNPTEFDPARFFARGKASAAFSASELFPFGGGIRRCIGMAFALYEMKMVLARLFARTDLEIAHRPIKVARRSITMVPKHGLRVRLVRREGRAAPPGA